MKKHLLLLLVGFSSVALLAGGYCGVCVFSYGWPVHCVSSHSLWHQPQGVLHYVGCTFTTLWLFMTILLLVISLSLTGKNDMTSGGTLLCFLRPAVVDTMGQLLHNRLPVWLSVALPSE